MLFSVEHYTVKLQYFVFLVCARVAVLLPKQSFILSSLNVTLSFVWTLFIPYFHGCIILIWIPWHSSALRQLNRHCVNSFGKCLKVPDVHLYVKSPRPQFEVLWATCFQFTFLFSSEHVFCICDLLQSFAQYW